MKNKLTRKLMLSAFTLLFAVISLGASTYAWFTMSESAKINAFEGKVFAGEGVEIAVTEIGHDPVEWFSGQIESKKIQDVVDKKFKLFEALTSSNGVSFKELVEHKPVANTSESNYIAFELHFKSAVKGTLTLDEMNFYSSESDSQPIDQVFTLAAGDSPLTVEDEIEFNVESAARVSLTANNSTIIYEDKEEAAADGNAGNSLGFSGVDENDPKGAFEYYNKKSYKLNDEGEYEGNLKASEAEDPTVSVIPTDKISTSTVTSIEIPGNNEIVSITVYVWIEGWDGECMNFIFNQMLSIDMTFAFAPDSDQED
jgi:hypothetical protein